MKPKWLVEKDTFVENLDPLYEAIKAQGFELKIADYVPFEGMDFAKQYDPSVQDCVITYCSLGMSQQVLKKTKWVPGAWCDLEKFKCTSYYPKYNDFLLNQNYIMLPFGELLRRRDFLFDTLGPYEDKVFVRPDSGNKTFSGTVVHKDNWKDAVAKLGFYDVDPASIVIVSETSNIRNEWRLVIVEGEVIAASKYKSEGLVKLEEGCPSDVKRFAKLMADIYCPERCFTMDICDFKDSGELLSIVEINSFSSSGLYVCDKSAVVEAVSRAALNEWKEYQNETQ